MSLRSSTPRPWFLALAFLATGMGLIACILTGIPLRWTLGCFVSFSLIGGGIVYKRLGDVGKKMFQHRFLSGLIGGLLATAAYDLSRYLLYLLFPFQMWPFEAIPLFGQLLVGNFFAKPGAVLFGIFYHVINGVAFGVAYSTLLAPKGWIAGIGWALFLETLMLLFYPGWLGVKFLEEFVTISVLGHLVYGFVLGMFCRWRYLKSGGHP